MNYYRFHYVTIVRDKLKMGLGCGELHPIDTHIKPKLWHQVGMDLIGPLTETLLPLLATFSIFFSK